MPEWLRLALVIAGKDLRAELRSRTAILSAVVFAALVLVVFNFARDRPRSPRWIWRPACSG